MKNIRNIIIILLAIFIILAIALIIIINSSSSDIEYSESDANSVPQDTMIELNEHISKETDDYKLFTINDYINEILDYENEENADAVNKLVMNYEDLEIMDLKQKQSQYYVQEMYKRENVNRANYYTSGILQTIDANYEEKLEAVYFKVNLDYENNALCIYVIDQGAFEQTKQDQESIVEDFSVEQNEYNMFEQKSYSTEERCNRYISDFIIKLKYNTELAYNFIDDEYKEQKFNNDFNLFNEYIENNKERIYNMTMERYLQEVGENSIIYTILDTDGNYYIIETSGGLEYKIKLDNYTIETEEYISTYEEATGEEKIVTNLSKVIKWINTKDYLQIYNKLDEEFKQNNFADIDAFENYMNENFFSNNIMEIENIEKITDTYICDTLLKSGYGLAAEERTQTFIMQLKEGTDFVMSFEV